MQGLALNGLGLPLKACHIEVIKINFENLKGRCGWELLDILQRKNKN